MKKNATRELIRLAYASATDPLQLPLLLAEYTKVVGAEGSGLVVQDLSNHNGSVTASWGFDPDWEKKYAQHYASTNIWIQRFGPNLYPGVIASSESVVSDNELLATEFYNDFLRPQNLFHSFGAAITRERDVAAYITSVRSKRAGAFGATAHRVCLEVTPHLQAALRVRHQFAGLEAQVAQLSGALDRLPQGIVITDAGSRILFMNRSAEAALTARNGLWIGPDGLRAARAEETVLLRELLKQAAQTVAANGTSSGGLMQISRPGRPPLKISISPLDAGSPGTRRKPAAILMMATPRDAGVDPRLLQHLFGFTPAEARLAAALVLGKSVKQFAEEAGVTLNTARTHLKNIFLKAGVTRQAGLVREVLATVEQLRQNL